MKNKSITYKRYQAKLRRKKSIRKKVFGTAEKPRLVVFRSLTNIYAQIINDDEGKTLVAASSKMKDFTIEDKKPTKVGFSVGKKLGELAIEKGINEICFDRNGYLYHGRVKALADGVRKAGVKF